MLFGWLFMNDNVVKALKYRSSSELIAKLSQDLENNKKPEEIAKNLADSLKILRLKDYDLINLSSSCNPWSPQMSARLILGQSNSQIPDLQIGDTIITPNGLWQIHPDFEEKLILNQQQWSKIAAIIPHSLKTDSVTPFRIIEINNQNTKDLGALVATLNTQCASRPNYIYLGVEESDIIFKCQEIMRILNDQYLIKALRNKDIFSCLWKLLGLKTESEFGYYALSIIHEYDGLQVNGAEKVGDYLLNYLNNSLAKKINLRKLNKQQLEFLEYAARNYKLVNQSTRIIRAASLDSVNIWGQMNLGDTILVPEGVFQIDYEGKSHKIMPPEAMKKIIRAEFIPTSNNPLEVINPSFDFSEENKFYQHALLTDDLMNVIAQSDLNSLCLTEEKLDYFTTAITASIAFLAKAEQALSARALSRIQEYKLPKPSCLPSFDFLLFKTEPKLHAQSNTNAPLPSSQSTLFINTVDATLNRHCSENSTAESRATEHQVPSPAKPRTIEEITASMDEIKEEISAISGIELSCNVEQKKQVVVLSTLNDNIPYMKASSNRVAVYKPLLEMDSLGLEDKANLFLQALGIPPTHGKKQIKVRGGHHHLRAEIRKLFKAYKAEEHSQPSKSLSSESAKLKFGK